jgi:hypothetical protein
MQTGQSNSVWFGRFHGGGARIPKSQAPNPKQFQMSKFQNQNRAIAHPASPNLVFDLVSEICLLFGASDLELTHAG